MDNCVNYTENFRFNWEDIKVVYELDIDTVPSSSKIYVNEKYVGESPLSIQEVLNAKASAVGSRTLYRTWTGAINQGCVEKWGPNVLTGKLKPDMPSNQIDIQAFKEGYNPAHRKLVIDNSDASIIQAFNNITPVDNDAGGQYSIPRSISASTNVLLTLNLKKAPIDTKPIGQQQQQQQQNIVIDGGKQEKDEKTGVVMLSSNVESADVYIDGIFVGNTPANLKLKSGIHIIEVKHSGYRVFKREMRVYPDSEVSLRAILNK